MGKNIVQKILKEHYVSGKAKPGEEYGIRIDQTLTQDATGTMAYLQFEAMGVPRVRTKKSVSYVDHNMLQSSFENADDHLFLQSVAAKYGIYFSRPGNGICHQVHVERFAVPGDTLLGSDSHTPTGGGVGMFAVGAGGLDVAVAMAGGQFFIKYPVIVGVQLTGRLQPWVSAKDIILELLRRLTVKGGVGKVIEYFGEGVETLSVPQRATITNMGAELGATTSVFPSDNVTKAFLKAQGRGHEFRRMKSDKTASYDEVITINLDQLEPMIAQPHSPDSVVPVRDVAGTKAVQVCVGSCTNSSFEDLSVVAAALKGKKIHPNLSFTINPGSKQVYEMIAKSGALADIISAGTRMLEAGCGPCIGMGQAPPSGGVSVRSFNRNFEGRSGTKDAKVYLTSPEVCVATALNGEISDPRKLGEYPVIKRPKKYLVDDGFIIPPVEETSGIEIIRGPNIKPCPRGKALENEYAGAVLLKVGDNITTDHIMPAGAKVLPLRSNIPKISEYVFAPVDETFAFRAREAGGGIVIGGSNYGQGSSREHAALAPMYLGVKAVISKSFARIHKDNLVNFGILPLVFIQEEDYLKIDQTDSVTLVNLIESVRDGKNVTVQNITKGFSFETKLDVTARQRELLLKGGVLASA